MTSAILAAMEPPVGALASITQSNQKHQCWECFRRRLVCDFSQPGCRKCRKAGIECPGYSVKKPVKWLSPGTVTCRGRTQTLAVVGQKNTQLTPEYDEKSSTIRMRQVVERVAAQLLRITESGVMQTSIYTTKLSSEIDDMVQAISYCERAPCQVIVRLAREGNREKQFKIAISLHITDNFIFTR